MGEQGELALGRRGASAITVTQLVRMVREALEVGVDECWVAGEISNGRVAPSGHFYFTLKDSRSAINAVMFRAAYRSLRFAVADGMEVIVHGRVSVYETRGTLQFYAAEMEPRGVGALQLAVEQLKTRLSAEGLFDAARKRPLPFLPRTIGLVTALGSAALRDMLTIMFGRFAELHVIIRPAPMQGPGASIEIGEALDDLNRDGRAELIIVGRGGGSLEDLWAFNEEPVARAIFRSKIPVVSAVGHEIDYTIADFTADVRAPTPTAAAQLVVPVRKELEDRLKVAAADLNGAAAGVLGGLRGQVEQMASRLREPRHVIRQARQRADEAAASLGGAMRELLADGRASVVASAERAIAAAHDALAIGRRRLSELAMRLDSLSPLRVLERGYAVVTSAGGSSAITEAATVAVGDELNIRLSRGALRARTIARELTGGNDG